LSSRQALNPKRREESNGSPQHRQSRWIIMECTMSSGAFGRSTASVSPSAHPDDESSAGGAEYMGRPGNRFRPELPARRGSTLVPTRNLHQLERMSCTAAGELGVETCAFSSTQMVAHRRAVRQAIGRRPQCRGARRLRVSCWYSTAGYRHSDHVRATEIATQWPARLAYGAWLGPPRRLRHSSTMSSRHIRGKASERSTCRSK